MNYMYGNSENNIGKRILTILAILLVAAIAFVLCYRVEQVTNHFVVELGDEVSTDLSDYITGQEWAVKHSTLDLSGVQEHRTGTFTAVVTHGWQTFTYEIIIQDTKAPKIKVVDMTFYVAADREYDLRHFTMEVRDASEQVYLTVPGDVEGTTQDFICFEEYGEAEFVLTATDMYGNSSSVTIPVYVDTAPEIEGVKECYIAVGSEPDFCNEVYAYDDFDGDLTGDIVVDEKELDCDKVGDYEITYYVEDGFGISTEESCVVHVMEETKIAELIATRTINRQEAYIVGVRNKYSTGAVKTATIQEQMDYVLPCLVHIRIGKSGGAYVGSGFIIDITDEYVYIGSNKHVLTFGGDRQVYFYDGAMATFEVVDMDEVTDTGVAKVRIEDIPQDTMAHLMSVNVSREAWERVDREEVPLFFQLLGSNGVEYSRTGSELGYDTEFNIVSIPTLRVTLRLEPGNSGSAIFDYEGNLIGIAVGAVTNPGKYVHYYAIGAEHLVRLYESATGNFLYKD